ncbi:MAG: nucleoside deaminase [Methylococcales bacterium]|nr:nucleoside deaminase [Methylococcales bacterium]
MHKKFLQQAIILASENASTLKGGPYAAIIVKNGELIAASSNCVTLHTDPTAHAEIMAIRLACKKLNDFQLSNCILYCSCEPCPMCLGAIYWARLERVYFACNRLDAADSGFDDSFIYDEISLPPEKRQIPMIQLKLKDAVKPFITWDALKNKTLY